MRYEVDVKFNKDFLVVEGGKITIGVRAKPVEGRANLEIVKRIAKHFDMPSSSVRIVAGFRSKRKVVEIL